MPKANAIIKALGRWGKLTVERHREHVEICRRLDIEPALFEAFASDVFGTPEDKRDWLLAVEPVANVEPFMRYTQYVTPKLDEQVSGLFYKDYRRGKKK